VAASSYERVVGPASSESFSAINFKVTGFFFSSIGDKETSY